MEKGLEPEKTRVLIVDDHPIVREGLAQLLNQEPDLLVCGQAEDARSALEAIEESQPDLILVDISLPGASGIELIKAIKVRHEKAQLMVLSMLDESLYAQRALRAGARGYIMKHEAVDELVVAIRRVLSGEIYVSDKVKGDLLEEIAENRPTGADSAVERLSDRELEVFRLMGQGYSTRRIAETLNLSIKTIESYREHLKEKLDLKDATELLRYAVQWAEGEQIR